MLALLFRCTALPNRRRTGRRGNCSVPASFSLLVRRRRGSGTWIPYAYPVHGGICWPREGFVHFLQSCQLFGRVLDEYSTDTTAPQLRGRVSGGPTPESATPCKPLATGARR